MALIEINWNPKLSELRTFAIALACLCSLAGFFCLQREASVLLTGTLLGVSLASCTFAWLAPQVMRPVYLVWMILFYPLRWLISCLLIAVVYYLVITPVGILLRLCGYDFVGKRFDSRATSYWQPKPQVRKPEDYFRQF
ncbi:SxtJ family membrane protein [Gimesia panareensis]|nr:SxtJ family membrane protein [Gimesia panareensis]